MKLAQCGSSRKALRYLSLSLSLFVTLIRGFELISSDHYQYNSHSLMVGEGLASKIDWFLGTRVHHVFWKITFEVFTSETHATLLLWSTYIVTFFFLFLGFEKARVPSLLIPVCFLLLVVDTRQWLGEALLFTPQALPHFLSMGISFFCVTCFLQRDVRNGVIWTAALFIVHFSTAIFISSFLVVLVFTRRGESEILRAFIRSSKKIVASSLLMVIIGLINSLRFISKSAGEESTQGFAIIRNFRAPWHYDLGITSGAQIFSIAITFALLAVVFWSGRSESVRQVMLLFVFNLFLCVLSEILFEYLNFSTLDALWPERTLPLFGALSIAVVASNNLMIRHILLKVIIAALVLSSAIFLPGSLVFLVLLTLVSLLHKLYRKQNVGSLEGGSLFDDLKINPTLYIFMVCFILTIYFGVYRKLSFESGLLIFDQGKWDFWAGVIILAAVLSAFFVSQLVIASRWKEWHTFLSAWTVLTILIVFMAPKLVEPWRYDEAGNPALELSLFDDDEKDLRDFASTELPVDDVYMIPPGFSMFRSIARRAVVVDFKAVPLAPPDYEEWFRRIAGTSGVEIDLKETVRDSLELLRSGYCGRSLEDLVGSARAFGAQFLVLEDGCAANITAPERLSHFAFWRGYRFYNIN